MKKELLHAQELGEILALGYTRWAHDKWTEIDREVILPVPNPAPNLIRFI